MDPLIEHLAQADHFDAHGRRLTAKIASRNCASTRFSRRPSRSSLF
jgi:hypothetical protein